MRLDGFRPQTWQGAVAVALVLACMIGLIAAQDAKLQAKPEPAPAAKVDGRALPAEVTIPEARRDKVDALQLRIDNLNFRQEALLAKLRETPEWKAIQDEGKGVADKLQAELVSALKGAGVEEKDFAQYTYDQRTMKFTLKKEDKPKQ